MESEKEHKMSEGHVCITEVTNNFTYLNKNVLFKI